MDSNKLVHNIMIMSYNGDNNTWTATGLLLAVESLEEGVVKLIILVLS